MIIPTNINTEDRPTLLLARAGSFASMLGISKGMSFTPLRVWLLPAPLLDRQLTRRCIRKSGPASAGAACRQPALDAVRILVDARALLARRGPHGA